MAQAMVNFRMDADLKKRMEAVCDELGMNMTTAFTVFAKKMTRSGPPTDNSACRYRSVPPVLVPLPQSPSSSLLIFFSLRLSSFQGGFRPSGQAVRISDAEHLTAFKTAILTIVEALREYRGPSAKGRSA